MESPDHRRVAGNVDAMTRRARDLRPIWPAVARELAAGERRHFAVGRAGLWPEAKDSTVRRKARANLPNVLMRAQGDLEDSLTVLGNRNMVLDARRLSLRFTTRVLHARWQNPSRPLVVAAKVTARRVSSIGQRWIAEGRR